jgi:hypothetical protein
MEFSPPFSLLKLNFAKTAKQLCLLVLLKISKNITIKIQTKENILFTYILLNLHIYIYIYIYV